jgi:hypothetical protein
VPLLEGIADVGLWLGCQARYYAIALQVPKHRLLFTYIRAIIVTPIGKKYTSYSRPNALLRDTSQRIKMVCDFTSLYMLQVQEIV